MILLAFVLSGWLIGRWWAPIPSVVTWTALGLAEEANHWGFGPGTRFGTAIEIHSANFGGDRAKDFKCDLLGCIALGTKLGQLAGQAAVLGSKTAIAAFNDRLHGEPLRLTIAWKVNQR